MTVLSEGCAFSEIKFPVCPICFSAFTKSGNSLICSNRHCYDIAKSGYVNLLPPSAGGHGDDGAMVRARRAFLEKGYYSALKDALCSVVLEAAGRVGTTSENTAQKSTAAEGALSGNTAVKSMKAENAFPGEKFSGEISGSGGFLLDCGCGEGYYTEAMALALPEMRVCGIDVSAKAAQAAAKRRSIFSIAAASANHIPCTPGFFDILVTVFAPFSSEQFKRALKPGGYFINVIPDEYHLWELKQVLYSSPYANEVSSYDIEGFDFIKGLSVKGRADLSCGEDISALFCMTPYCHRTEKDAVQRLFSLERLSVRTEFRILVYRRRARG